MTQHIGYPRCKTYNPYCSVEKDFQNGALTILLSILPIKTGNQLVMHKRTEIKFQLPILHDQKSLTLCWLSSYCIFNPILAAIDNYMNDYIDILVAFTTDLESGFWQSRV
jgi:hypothetical protein